VPTQAEAAPSGTFNTLARAQIRMQLIEKNCQFYSQIHIQLIETFTLLSTTYYFRPRKAAFDAFNSF
jgi:hypothetical protein